MTKSLSIISEEDVRSKLVTLWLKDHGFGLKDFSLEYGFEIQFGHSVKRRPRSDVLVRSTDGRNLLVIEVKSQKITLSDKDKRQAISYARLLREGGIAPFTIITNGKNTQIFDSLTEELINDSTIPLDHSHVLAGYKVTGFDLSIRSEALESLISLSSENLLQFCISQVAYRMKLLKSDGLYDGKKYVPELFIERDEAKKNFIKLLDTDKRNVVVLQGGPQVGKTNFVCHTVEEFIADKRPCLFFPAISMQKGLIEEISEDFHWLIGETRDSYYLISQKLSRILENTNQKLVIFIDGWNESDTKIAKAIDQASDKLTNNNIQIVISMTNTAARRLLTDETGNLSKIADAASIASPSIQRIELNPENIEDEWSVVYLPKYSASEIGEAYKKYSKAYNVSIPRGHIKTDEPFLLRVAMEQFNESVLPAYLDEPKLMEFSIKVKSHRVKGLSENSTLRLLVILAKEIFLNDAPISDDLVLKKWGMNATEEPPQGLFEAALLLRTWQKKGKSPSLDFYYSRERDYLISLFARQWDEKFFTRIDHADIDELHLAIKTNAGIDALRWFLSQEKNLPLLEGLLNNEVLKNNEKMYSILLQCLGLGLIKTKNHTYDGCLKIIIPQAIKSRFGVVKVEAARLLLLTGKLPNNSFDTQSLIMNGAVLNERLVIGLLNVEEFYPISTLSISSYILEFFSNLQYESEFVDLNDEGSESELVILLDKLLDSSIITLRLAAAKVFGHIAPYQFLNALKRRIFAGNIDGSSYEANDEHASGLIEVSNILFETYYGGMCKGRLSWIEDSPEELAYEYKEVSELTSLIIDAYNEYECGHNFQKLLDDLKCDDDPQITEIDPLILKRYQIKLL